ncbi:hypothetical protein TrRE_jg5675 [Triparma retinervis]|uniref:Uncharacterized protein n=1 Tax=Triparma retinervis TaxID=2557542 RepID=A0A9W7F7H3_9STRA|nr:hypothetical protein TrRE_jg5675 [Triparma retinervis]
MLILSITSSDLADGFLVASCLPMTPNMAIVFTGTAGGDEAAAVFNSAVSNLVGIFLTPALVLMYLGSGASIEIIDVFLKLVYRVLIPLIVGQVVQYKCRNIKVSARRGRE